MCCLVIAQISAGQKLTGRTCATALSACVRQGMIWVYPSPGPAPSQDTIPGDLCQQGLVLQVSLIAYLVHNSTGWQQHYL